MRIAELVEIGRIAFRETERPVTGPGEMVVKVGAVGLCGTDLKAYLRGHPYFTPPCVLGHEFAGTVAEVGPGVDAFHPGEAVVAAPYVECGTCDLCRKGLGELCRRKAFIEGALQEYVRLPADIVRRGTFLLPDGVGPKTGTLAEPLACAVNGVEKAGIAPGETVLVVGGGPMGALLAMIARSITPHVLISEIAPARLDALRSLGLSTVDASAESVTDRLHDAFGAPLADKVLIAVGVRDVAEEAMAWTAPGGTALLFGGLPKDERLTIDPFAVHYQEVSIVGSFGFRLDHFRAAVAWLAEHADQAEHLITDTVPFEQVEDGFHLARSADGLKTVVRLGEHDAG